MTRTGATKPSDFSKVLVKTTVHPKAEAFPTDAKLTHRAREPPVRLAKKRRFAAQSHARLGQRALMLCARQQGVAQRADLISAVCSAIIVRKTKDDGGLRQIFATPLSLAFQVRKQRQNQLGRQRSANRPRRQG